MIRWVWAFVDRPAERFDESARFWSAVTATSLSARRGERGQFATFLPAEGDAYVKLQANLEGGGAHIDLEFDDFDAALYRAVGLGAKVVEVDGAWAHLKSPSGYGLCVTGWRGGKTRPAPVAAPDGTRTLLDQVCVDIAPSAFDAEAAFWSGLTRLELVPGTWDEFSYLRPPEGSPIRILLQRLEEERPTSAHLDIRCLDVDATRLHHESLGALFLQEGKNWSVMQDPAGGVYCLIRRDPGQ